MSYASVPFVARGPNGKWRYLSGLGEKAAEIAPTVVPTIVNNEKASLMPAATAVVDALTPTATAVPTPAPAFDTSTPAVSTPATSGGVPMWAVVGSVAALLAGGVYWATSKPSVKTNRRRTRR